MICLVSLKPAPNPTLLLLPVSIAVTCYLCWLGMGAFFFLVHLFAVSNFMFMILQWMLMWVSFLFSYFFGTCSLMDSSIAPFCTALSCCEKGLCQVLQGTTAVENSALCSAICSALLATNTGWGWWRGSALCAYSSLLFGRASEWLRDSLLARWSPVTFWNNRTHGHISSLVGGRMLKAGYHQLEWARDRAFNEARAAKGRIEALRVM